MRTFHFFGVRLRSAARWSWQRPSGQLANALVREEPPKSTCALIASRCAAHHARDRKGFNRKPAPQPSHSESRTVWQRTRKGCPFASRLRAGVYSNEERSPTAPISSRTLWRDSLFADDRGRARSATVVRRFRGPCLEIARVVSGAARGVKRAGTLWWFFPDRRGSTKP